MRLKFAYYEWGMLALFAAFGILLGAATHIGWWTLVPAAVMAVYGYGYVLFGDEQTVLGLEVIFTGWWCLTLVAAATAVFITMAVTGGWNPVTGVLFLLVAVVLLVVTSVSAPLAPHHAAHGATSTRG